MKLKDCNIDLKSERNVRKLLGKKSNKIVLIGDSEDFDIDYMEELDNIIAGGNSVDRIERYDKEYDTHIIETLYDTHIGKVCIVSGETRYGTISVYFTDEETGEKIENQISQI